MFTRYAVYFAPIADNPLGIFGNSWLGWDINTAKELERPNINDLPDSIENLTKTPQKYGFHGTLKAPFDLKGKNDVNDLRQAVFDFAKTHKAFNIGNLHVSNLGGFVALIQREPSRHLITLASECVMELDRFRAPLSEDDIKRRLQANLSTRQEHLMRTWGYPYIMDEFHFHLTLTGKLSDADASIVQLVLSKQLKSILDSSIIVSDVCLCGQRYDGQFQIIERFSLAG
jgi:putative phosphonate metabolism protein